MLAAAERLEGWHPCTFRLIQAATVSDSVLAEPLADCELKLEIVQEDRFRAVADSHLAICASGTATLEVGLLQTPMVVGLSRQSLDLSSGQPTGTAAPHRAGQSGPRQAGCSRIVAAGGDTGVHHRGCGWDLVGSR